MLKKYLNTLQQKNLIQQDSACDQIVKNSSTSIQIEIKNNAELLNDIIMINKLIRHISVSREKKLTKELKNQAKKSFEKLLILFMKQEICEITVQNILKFFNRWAVITLWMLFINNKINKWAAVVL